MKKGFSLVEMMLVLGILAVCATIVTAGFVSYQKSRALALDTETSLSVLAQARSQTLSSRGGLQYGVHFSSSQVTLFTGSGYSAGGGNKNYPLSVGDTVLTISLTGGGSDVIFQKLSGETAQNGTITISSTATGKTKVITIYKTGIIESN